jgi:hypothetical protein
MTKKRIGAIHRTLPADYNYSMGKQVAHPTLLI